MLVKQLQQHQIRFLLISWGLLVWASVSLIGQEAYLHMDRPFYVTGERIWFKVYLPKSLTHQKATYKVQLWGANGLLVPEVFIAHSENGAIDGYLDIPYQSKSGLYNLVVSGLQLPEKTPLIVMEGQIPIYNDLIPFEGKQTDMVSENLSFERNAKEDLIVRVSVPTSSPPAPRQPVSLLVNMTNALGEPVEADFSVAVFNYSLLANDAMSNYPLQRKVPALNAELNLAEGLFYKGSIHKLDQSPLASKYLGVFFPDQNRFIYTQAEELGHFNLTLPTFFESQVIHLMDRHVDSIQTILIAFPEVISPSPLPFNATIQNYLTISQQQKKINQLFGKLQFESSQQDTAIQATLEPDATYLMDQYVTFPDLPTFFREIVTPLKFRKEKNTYVARIFNSEPTVRLLYNKGPLFVVDGQLTRDADFIAQLNLRDIHSIEMTYRIEKVLTHYGQLGEFGVVTITSKDQSIEVPTLDARNRQLVSGYQPPRTFQVTYLPVQGIPTHTPVFRPTIYWDAHQSTLIDGQTSITFDHTDDIGTFLVMVVARTADGVMGVGKVTYKVK